MLLHGSSLVEIIRPLIQMIILDSRGYGFIEQVQDFTAYRMKRTLGL